MRTATLDLNFRGSFVDDLNSMPGIVMCRDALLHRSHEIQPAHFDSFVFFFFYALWDLFALRLSAEPGLAFFCVKDANPWPKLCGPEQVPGSATKANHTFSAFWLRSSVVSVLISLISGTWRMASHEFK